MTHFFSQYQVAIACVHPAQLNQTETNQSEFMWDVMRKKNTSRLKNIRRKHPNRGRRPITHTWQETGRRDLWVWSLRWHDRLYAQATICTTRTAKSMVRLMIQTLMPKCDTIFLAILPTPFQPYNENHFLPIILNGIHSVRKKTETTIHQYSLQNTWTQRSL